MFTYLVPITLILGFALFAWLGKRVANGSGWLYISLLAACIYWVWVTQWVFPFPIHGLPQQPMLWGRPILHVSSGIVIILMTFALASRNRHIWLLGASMFTVGLSLLAFYKSTLITDSEVSPGIQIIFGIAYFILSLPITNFFIRCWSAFRSSSY